MIFHISVENYFEGKTLAWVLNHPGCFIAAENSAAVQAILPETIRDYAAWIA
jgi:hypothetical protein